MTIWRHEIWTHEGMETCCDFLFRNMDLSDFPSDVNNKNAINIDVAL